MMRTPPPSAPSCLFRPVFRPSHEAAGFFAIVAKSATSSSALCRGSAYRQFLLPVPERWSDARDKPEHDDGNLAGSVTLVACGAGSLPNTESTHV